MQELTIQEHLTPLQIRAQINLIQEVMQTVMKKDVHYGVIPGCKAPSLYKPGAEKIMATFRFIPEYLIVDYSTDDEIRYQITTSLKSPNNIKVGEGIGECSSNEEKYKWRQAICEEEFNAMPEDKRRTAYKRGKQGSHYTVQQIRTNGADMRNTILKMAKKRSLVDAVITCTAASDIFTQDIEDLPDEYINTVIDSTAEEIPQYPDAEFKKNFPAWKKLIELNKKTPQDIIAMVNSRYQLTDSQLDKINKLEAIPNENIGHTAGNG